MSVKEDNPGLRLIELADKTGVAITRVKDGHMLCFTKKHLEGMLEEINKAGQDKCIVFLKNHLTIN